MSYGTLLLSFKITIRISYFTLLCSFVSILAIRVDLYVKLVGCTDVVCYNRIYIHCSSVAYVVNPPF